MMIIAITVIVAVTVTVTVTMMMTMTMRMMMMMMMTTAEIAMLSARGLRGLVWAWQINIVMWRTCDEHVEPGQGTRQSLEIWLFWDSRTSQSRPVLLPNLACYVDSLVHAMAKSKFTATSSTHQYSSIFINIHQYSSIFINIHQYSSYIQDPGDSRCRWDLGDPFQPVRRQFIALSLLRGRSGTTALNAAPLVAPWPRRGSKPFWLTVCRWSKFVEIAIWGGIQIY